jgi:TamB, inner membrane protein subunit of TAM complex
LARTAARVLLGLLTMGILVASGLVLGLYLGGATWAVNRVLAEVNPYPGTTLQSARVGGSLFRTIRLYDVRLTRPDGAIPVRLDSLTLTYDPRTLLGGGVLIQEARLAGPSVTLTQRPDSKWDLLDLPRGASDSSSSSGSSGAGVTIERLSITGGSAWVRFAGSRSGRGHRVEGLEAEGTAIRIARGISIGQAVLRLRVRPQSGAPAWVDVAAGGSIEGARLSLDTLSLRSPESVVAARGAIPLPSGGDRPRHDLRGLGIHLTARPLAWNDLRLLKPELDRPGTVSLTLDGRGEANGAAVNLIAESSDGGSAEVRGFLTAPGASPLAYRGDVRVRRLDPSLFSLDPSRGDRVNADVRLDVRGPRLDSLDGRARVRLFDSRYRALRTRRLAGSAEFAAGRSEIGLEGKLGPARVAVDGWLRAFDSLPTYALAARVAGAPENEKSAWLERLFGAGERRLLLRVTGRELDPDLADLHAVVTVAPPSGSPGVLDSGMVKARLAGGRFELSGYVGATGGLLALRGKGKLGRDPQYRIEGEVSPTIDLAALLGDSTTSAVGGAFFLEGRGIRPQSLRGHARVSAGGSYGAHQLARTHLDLRMTDGNARLTGRAFVDGASVELGAIARPFDREPALTVRNLRFRHLDVARLAPRSGLGTDLTGTVTLRARGRKLDGLRLSGELLLEPSRAGVNTIDSATVTGSLTRGDLDLRLSLAAPAGALALDATARPLDSVPRYAVRDARFHDVELGRLLQLGGLHTRLGGSLHLEGSGRRRQDATFVGRLSLGPSTLNRVELREGELRAAFTSGTVHLTGELLGEGNSVLIDGTMKPFEAPRPVRLTSVVGIRDLGRLLAHDDLDAGVAARVSVEGEWGGRDSTRLEGTILGSGRFGALLLDSLLTRLGFAGGVLRVDTLDMRSNVGAATATGTIALFGPVASARSDLRVQATLSDLAPLGATLGLDGLGLDSGRVTLAVEGTRDRPSLRADVDGTGLAIGGRRVSVVRGSVHGELAPDHSIGTGDGELLLERVYTPRAPASNVHVQGSYRAAELALRAQVDQHGRRRARLVARAHPGSGEGRVELDTIVVRSETESWTLAHPVRITYGKQFRVDDFIISSAGRRLAIDGTVDREGEQRLGVQLDSFPVGWLAEIAGLPTLEGEINGSFALSGAAASPRLAGGLDVALQSRGKAIGRSSARVEWTGRTGLGIDLGLYHPKGDSLRVEGQVPLALSLAADTSGSGLVSRIPSGTLRLDARAEGFGLDLLEPLLDPLTIKSFRGRLSLDARARGTLGSPELSGRMDLEDAKLVLPRLGATYQEGRVRTSLAGREVRLEEARVRAGDGHAEAQGTIRLQEFPKAALDVQATLVDFRAADGENLRTTVSGKVQLTGTNQAPWLKGGLEVRNSDLYLQTANRESSAEEVELTTEDRRTLERRFGVTPDRQRGDALAPWGLDLGLKLGENTWVRRRTNPAVAVEVAGQLQVRKQPQQELGIFGSVRPLAGRSFVDLLGRRFEVTSGEVALSGPLDSVRFEMQAEYRADSGSSTPSGVMITTQVSVDSGRLAVTLGSRPPMSMADIRSYLATGRPAGTDPTEASNEQDVATTGASIAMGAALGTLAGGAGQRLGFDVVQILQDRGGGQTLVAGKYVSAPLYLGFRQPIVVSEDETGPEGTSGNMEWELEYAALRRALLNVQGAGKELRVFLRLRR